MYTCDVSHHRFSWFKFTLHHYFAVYEAVGVDGDGKFLLNFKAETMQEKN